jgi:hypothetical protein
MTTQSLDRRPRSAHIIPIAATVAGIGLATVLAVTAFSTFGGGGGNGGGVGAPPPTASPTAVPTRVPTPVPTPVATDGGSDAMPIKVDLENVTGANVYVDIVDQTGLLVHAASGSPADGMSVEPYTLSVENIDATTLRLTWVDFPIDNALALYIDEHEGGVRLLLVQPEPKGPTDSIGLDRELVLSFSQPISADSVEAILQDGLDTPG